MGAKKTGTGASKRNREIELNSYCFDRESQRHNFMRHLVETEISGVNEDGMLIFYSGVGGIGKTMLFKKFEEISKAQGKKFVRHDLKKEEKDMLKTLNVLRKKLSNEYEVEFPLFDKGCIYLAENSNEFVSGEQKISVLKSSSVFRSLHKKFSVVEKANAVSVAASKIFKFVFKDDDETLEDLQTLANGILSSTPIFKLTKPLLNFIDAFITKNEMEARKNGNTYYAEVAEELQSRKNEDDPCAIREFLPTLFAQDLSFWLNKNETDLIIFLDTYEELTGEEKGKIKNTRLIFENRDVPVDWWIGELLTCDRVIWVIAGRYEPDKIGEICVEDIGKVVDYNLEVFDEKLANQYLEILGVAEENIRNKIVEITGGHPFYIGKCFITYDNNRRKGKVPRLSDFGENLSEVVERAVGSLDENSLFLLQKLCILGRWTDEIVSEVINDYNPNTYARLTGLFAEKFSFDFDDDEIDIYSFDKTIGSFLLPSLKNNRSFDKYFVQIRDAANAYFGKSFFAESRCIESDSKDDYYFGIWRDIILRTTDEPAELMDQYKENFLPLEEQLDNSTLATVVKEFLEKVGDTQTLPSAYFQYVLGEIRLLQNRIKEALALSEAACSKIENLPLTNEQRKIRCNMRFNLADVYDKLECYPAEIEILEKAVEEAEKYFPDKILVTLEVKKDLAHALEKGNKANEAFNVHCDILKTLKTIDSNRYIEFARTLARKYSSRYNPEVTKIGIDLYREAIAFCEENNDDENLICVLHDYLCPILNDYSFFMLIGGQEIINRQRQFMELCEKAHVKFSQGIIKKFVEALRICGCDDEAEQLSEKYLKDFSEPTKENSSKQIEDLKRRIESANPVNAISTLKGCQVP